MYDKAVLENGRTLKSVPDSRKNQQMCYKAVDNYPHGLGFVSDCYKTKEVCDKAVNFFIWDSLHTRLNRYEITRKRSTKNIKAFRKSI